MSALTSLSRRPRIFYLARTPPSMLSGATLAMRRHFIEHSDFEIFIATSEHYDNCSEPFLHVLPSPVWRRLKSTRLIRLLHNAEILCQPFRLPKSIVNAARLFGPDAVFTIADLTLSEPARLLARHLGVPLIVNFQDWWPRGQFYYSHEAPYRLAVPFLEHRFRTLYRQADLAFCTSEGMREFLGDHKNSHVLYPIGSSSKSKNLPERQIAHHGRKRRLLYTGTAFGSYGQMLLQLAVALKDHPSWELVIYGNRPDWPSHTIAEAEQSGLYRGFLPFDQLQQVLASADACLSVMSFEPALEAMMRTSFTTKILDYCQAGSPILMWGPSFCSPIRLIEKYHAGLTITTPDPSSVLSCLRRLDSEPGLSSGLARSAKRLAEGELSHDNIHSLLVWQIHQVIARECPL